MVEVLISRDPLAVRLVAPSTDMVAAVAALVRPHFRVESIAGGRWDFTVVAGECGDLLGAREDRLHIDGEPARAYLVYDEHLLVAIKEPTERSWLIQHVLRLVRSLFRCKIASLGAVFLHASMIRWRGKGVVFVGDKRSGKTTSMLSLLAAGADYVANDDVALIPDHAVWNGIGSNRTVAVRSDTARLPHLRHHFVSGQIELEHPFNRYSEETAYRFIRPIELASLFACDTVLTTRLDTVLFPKFRQEPQGLPYVRKLNSKDSVAMLLKNSQSPLDKYTSGLSSLLPVGLEAATSSMIEQLVRQVGCYEVEQSFNSMDKVRYAIEDILEVTKT